MALLHVASGHFSRIEYASGGSLPGSLVSEFAFIAGEYVKNIQQNFGTDYHPETQQRSTPAADSQNVDYMGASFLPVSSSERQFQMPSVSHDPLRNFETPSKDDILSISCRPMTLSQLPRPRGRRSVESLTICFTQSMTISTTRRTVHSEAPTLSISSGLLSRESVSTLTHGTD
jgi:hypothetical protein